MLAVANTSIGGSLVGMQSYSDSGPYVKKLGELLLEAGFISDPDLQKAVDLSRKNFQSLGKVLAGWKFCRQEDINAALDVQRICKLEGMSGKVAVRTLLQVRNHVLSVPNALIQVGWTKPNYNPFQEPDSIAEAKLELRDLGTMQGIPRGLALLKIGEAYAQHQLAARAEVWYDQAIETFEAAMPDSTPELSNALSKMGELALEYGRLDEAKELVERAAELLKSNEPKHSKEYAKVMHVSAEYQVSKRKYGDAEKNYVDCVNMLLPSCGLLDEQVLETIRRYVLTIEKCKKEVEKATMGELVKGAGILTEEQLTAGWQLSKRSRIQLGEALVNLGYLKERQIQLILQAQTLARNAEITTQLATWIVMYGIKLNKSLDSVLSLFKCEPKSRAKLIQELKAATETLADLETRLPPTHTELAFAHAKVAGLYFQRQQWEEAEFHYKKALDIFWMNPNLNAEKAIEVLDNYFEMKEIQEEHDEAIRLAKLAVQMRSRHYGQFSVLYAKGLIRLARAFCKKGDHVTAISCLDRALEIEEKLYGNDDREILSCLEAKGDCHCHAEDFNAAEQTFDKAVAIAEDNFGKTHEAASNLLRKLVVACKATGNLEKINQIAPGALKED